MFKGDEICQVGEDMTSNILCMGGDGKIRWWIVMIKQQNTKCSQMMMKWNDDEEPFFMNISHITANHCPNLRMLAKWNFNYFWI